MGWQQQGTARDIHHGRMPSVSGVFAPNTYPPIQSSVHFVPFVQVYNTERLVCFISLLYSHLPSDSPQRQKHSSPYPSLPLPPPPPPSFSPRLSQTPIPTAYGPHLFRLLVACKVS